MIRELGDLVWPDESNLSKKRGLSLEEKREQMLQIFYESQDFYLLKELEKLGPKKGVISQSVKDVVQSLVDDDLVLKDKIGTSVYFWSLPSCAGNQLWRWSLGCSVSLCRELNEGSDSIFGVDIPRRPLRNTYNKLESDLSNSKKRYVELVEHRDNLKRGREDSEERESALEELKAVELHHKKLKEELAAYADSDPAAVEAMKDAIDVAHSAANRWTDNIFTLQQWCSTTFPQAKEQLEHMYREVGITEDFEYLQ
ncbi:hypothetical protein C2845_PM03G29200 [Panicum miliaceum]|uniref:Meiotic nuclear division protein 1 homolog n=1 Tax=Panicum miliaceum TaxID=4540 RepID=A0A3L6TDI9_PANMI|nr:hypothetical protein C2845_PM03G29200 [Panicum miliaceum]